MTFEQWWDFNYVKKGFLGGRPGIMGEAFKEVAKKAWDASEEECAKDSFIS